MIKNKNKVAMFNIASTVILQGLALISAPIISKILGKENYGIASVYLTWVQLASTVFSLQAAGTVALARVNFPESDQEKYQSSVLSLSLLFYALFSALTLAVVAVLNRWLTISLPMTAAVLLHGWGMYCVSFANSKFTYEFKADKNFILSVFTALSNIGLSLLLIRMFEPENNYWGRIIAQSSVYTLIGAVI